MLAPWKTLSDFLRNGTWQKVLLGLADCSENQAPLCDCKQTLRSNWNNRILLQIELRKWRLWNPRSGSNFPRFFVSHYNRMKADKARFLLHTRPHGVSIRYIIFLLTTYSLCVLWYLFISHITRGAPDFLHNIDNLQLSLFTSCIAARFSPQVRWICNEGILHFLCIKR